MAKLNLSCLLIIGILMSLVGCSSVETKEPVVTKVVPVVNLVFIATGYSPLMHLPQLTAAQNRIAAEQNAKLNAYRDLAKQLYAEKLPDGRVIADLVIEDERYRVYLDLFLREAKLVESGIVADQRKVVLELTTTPRFYQCFSGATDVVSQCLLEDKKNLFTRIGYQHAPVSKINLACATTECVSQLSMSGFSKEKHKLDKVMLDNGLYDTEWTLNMTIKAMLRYFLLTGVVFK